MKPQDLGDGLTMRNATAEDIPALLEHFRAVHGEGVVDQLRAMLEHYPRFSWENSFIIANSESGEVVSCVILLQNAWVIDGIQVPSVEMEAVGTLEAYRNRGHSRLLNEEYERLAKQIHPVIQTIAGIPYFYRNFGYEYAAALGGGYPVNPSLIPKLPDREKEPVTFEMLDAKRFEEFLAYREKHLPRSTWIRKIRTEDAAYLIYETTSHEQEAFYFYLVKEHGKTVGVFYLARWENRLDIVELYLDDHQHVDAVLRFAVSRTLEWDGIPVRVNLPNQARIREYVNARTQVKDVGRYAWYIKIPSITRFIETISPLFSNRLKDTEFPDFTGELTVTDYKQGYSLSFDGGVFKEITEKSEKKIDDYHLRIPRNQLTRLLMGYETLDGIASHEPDVQCAAVLKPLVRALFPKLEAMVDPYY
jgi:N-acetylglutamate synthase-like GNAT family acetyltransferase